MTGLFVTGTDTEVGKTMVTAALAAGYRARGHRPVALKPLATGGPPPGEDALLLGEAAGHPPHNHTCLPVPASPERAAIEAGVTLELDAVLAWVRTRGEGADPLLVEGVGGWCVPIGTDVGMSDLAEALELPVVVVAANRLGMLNHTLLTVNAVRASGLNLAGIVINDHFAPASPLAGWNARDIERHVGSHVPIARFSDASGDLGQTGLTLMRALNL